MTEEGLGELISGEYHLNTAFAQNWLLSFTELMERQKEEREYIENIAKKIGGKKDSNYINAQHVIIAIHLEVDKKLTEFIGMMLDYGVENFKEKKFTQDSITDNAVAQLTVYSRLKIVKALRYFSGDSMRFMERLNEIRNSFAHSKKEKEGQFLYRNESVFTKKGIELIMNDYDIFIKEWIAYSEKYIEYLKQEREKLK
jgi:hypothetical protein